MAAAVARQDAADQWEAQRAEAARADEVVMAARVAEHLAHQHEALTGYTAEELRQAQQARGDHLAAVGWDPAAPVGSPAHPEILIDGASVSTMSGAQPAEAAR